MFFSGITGHESVYKELLKDVLANRLYGSFLFTGPKGIGKSLVAKRLAKYVSCLGDQDDTCTCSGCLRYPQGEDTMMIEAGESGSIKLSDVQEVSDFLEGRSRSGGPRIVVVDDADVLTHAAASSFLKILETDRMDWVVIFVSSSPENVIPTIVSRSQVIEFSSLGREEVLSILKERKSSGKNFDALAACTPYLSKSLFECADEYGKASDLAFKFLKALISSKESALVSILSLCEKEVGKDGVALMVECLMILLDDLLKIRLSASREVRFRKDMESLQELSEKLDEVTILAVQNMLKIELQNHLKGFSSPIELNMVSVCAKAKHYVKQCLSKREGTK